MSKMKMMILGIFGAAVLAGCGGSSSDPLPGIPINPIARVGTYLVAADLTGVLSVYGVDPVSGVLNEVNGSPFQAGNSLSTVAVHPNGRFVYGGVNDAAILEGFSLDPSSGALTPLENFPIPAALDGAPFFDNTGAFLYMPGETTIDGFRVNSTSGGLIRLPGFPLAVPGMLEATSYAISPNNNVLYIADRGSNQIFAFSRNAETGSLTLLEAEPSGAVEPTGLELTPDGQFLYAAHQDGLLPGFDIQPDGTLEPLAGAPVAYAAGQTLAWQMAVVDDVLFVPDAAGDLLNAFRIGASGNLTQVAGYPRSGGGANAFLFPFFFADILYVSDTANNAINAYLVDENGGTTPVSGSPFPGNGAPVQLDASVVSF